MINLGGITLDAGSIVIIFLILGSIIVSVFLNILDLYAYVAAVTLCVMAFAFAFFGNWLLFFLLFTSSLVLTGVLLFFRFVKNH